MDASIIGGSMSAEYRVRAASLADADVLVHHRTAMFTDMGLSIDADALGRAFRAWLADTMGSGSYKAWVVETSSGSVVAGGGISILPWPPGPRSLGTQLAFVYNVYVEPEHRRRGVARRIMDAIHDYCRGHGIGSVALNASRDGKELYDAIGYVVAPNPMMVYSVKSDRV
jgi:GNAT superfamily N-acetyltransferase